MSATMVVAMKSSRLKHPTSGGAGVTQAQSGVQVPRSKISDSILLVEP